MKNAKRLHATVSFIAGTGLKDATDNGTRSPTFSCVCSVLMDRVQFTSTTNYIIKDFPFNELLSATDLDKIQESLLLIFGDMNRKS